MSEVLCRCASDPPPPWWVWAIMGGILVVNFAWGWWLSGHLDKHSRRL